MGEGKFENNVVNIKDAEEEKIKAYLEKNYQEYLKLDGIINKGDYDRILKEAMILNILDKKASEKKALDKDNSEIETTIKQGVHIADFAKIISLNNPEKNFDPKLDLKMVLYVLLRTDFHSEGAQNHHGQMSDQRLFVEAVKMAGDADALDKLIKAYPNIFKHEGVQEIQEAA